MANQNVVVNRYLAADKLNYCTMPANSNIFQEVSKLEIIEQKNYRKMVNLFAILKAVA